ncbi:hypothetical protein [Brevibacillus laterosporus]|uniref:hypothetical protein n=1 Tax=Brevibacillus laterosporus TaxID=1465 RepID=UPI00264B8FF9|nr:hypothetical protein [Brevibacillus laterosporus]MDN9012152.1 hypothetical protein [Brevibacillus laterosporus]MDO0943248.1 hypothetical protein [Brevibacillus laterosporus]
MYKYTVRLHVPQRRGRVHLRLANPDITRNSVIHISVSEARPLGGIFGAAFNRIFGSASITVQNITPSDGEVNFYVLVDWPQPLDIAADISIFDPTENIVYGR